MLPGITRDDPDYFAVVIMNDILGGGGYHPASRIACAPMKAGMMLIPVFQRICAPLTGFNPSRGRFRTASIVLEEMKRMAAAPVMDEELNTSSGDLLIGSRTFATKRRRLLTPLPRLGHRSLCQRPVWKKYRSRLEALNKEDVLRVAKKFLIPDKLAILVVGQKKEILLGHPNHDVKLTELTRGQLTDVPLRDPLTMQPIHEHTDKEKASAQ